MTDKVPYTVTMQVEVEAEGPARAVRQALDWARDTESRGGVITVKPGTLAALQASTRAGEVAELFTGPVTTNGPIRTAADVWRGVTLKGVDPDKVRELVADWRQVVRSLGAVNIAFDRVKEAETRTRINSLQQCIRDLEALTDGQ